MAGHRCFTIHWLIPKTRVDVNNGQLKVIKATLRLSRHRVYVMMFEVGIYLQSLTITKAIAEEALIYLGHWGLAMRFICPTS